MDVLEVNAIRKEYGTFVAVDDVSFSVQAGHVLGLIGPNGAGKTTLLRILATLLRPTCGMARVFGHDLTKQYRRVRKHIGYMPDFFNLYYDLTLAECLDFFARTYGVEPSLIPGRIDEVLKWVELDDRKNSFIRHLSRGMVQRMGVAALLVHQPDIFLLDEPASGLDPRSRIQLRRVLKKLSTDGKTIIISSHILTELSGFCTHVAIMNKGRIELFGPVDEVQRAAAGARRLNITVIGDSGAAASLLKQLANVKVMFSSDGTIAAETTGSAEEVAGINTYLVQNGIRVVSFCEEKADLEDLFMKIAGSPEQMP
jgi:ABC-2 type transport system ATP-binding protein